jgi:hypothetical protein
MLPPDLEHYQYAENIYGFEMHRVLLAGARVLMVFGIVTAASATSVGVAGATSARHIKPGGEWTLFVTGPGGQCTVHEFHPKQLRTAYNADTGSYTGGGKAPGNPYATFGAGEGRGHESWQADATPHPLCPRRNSDLSQYLGTPYLTMTGHLVFLVYRDNGGHDRSTRPHNAARHTGLDLQISYS